MKPNLMTKTTENNCYCSILTTGNHRLTARAIFGKEEFGPIFFQVNKYEKIPIKSVKDVDVIRDYYFSQTMASNSGWNTIDGEKFTESINHGEKPICNVDDAVFVKTCSSGKLLLGPRARRWI